MYERETSTMFAAMSAAAAAGSDPSAAMVLASEMSALAANGKPYVPPSLLDVLTLPQAADYLQLSENAILSEANAGRLPGRCLNGEWRFARRAIVDWLREGDRSPSTRQSVSPGAANTDEDPEEIIAAIYRERKKHPVGD